jgi:flavin-binding protein dodecin
LKKEIAHDPKHREALDPQSTYDVIELIGTSTESWEDAPKNVIDQAGEHLQELRIAEVVAKDMVIRDGKVKLYRTKVKVSFKYKGHELRAAKV